MAKKAKKARPRRRSWTHTAPVEESVRTAAMKLAQFAESTKQENLTVLPGGGTRRSKSHRFDLVPPEGYRNTADRFAAGALIHGEWNWKRSCESEEDAAVFAREAFNHGMNHMLRMSENDHDEQPGGNIGAVGWMVAVISYIERKFGKPWTELNRGN